MCEGVKSYIGVDCAKDNSDLLQIQIIFFFKQCYFNYILNKISLLFQFRYLYSFYCCM